MTVSELLKEGATFLAHRATPRLDAEVVLAYLLHLTKEQLFCSIDMEVDAATEAEYRRALEQMADGKPVSYVTHEKEFYGRSFYVDERVLIPRPETEKLVEQVMRLAKEWNRLSADAGRSVRILDLGTGSGCIGLSLTLEIPDAELTVADVSADALEVVNKNIVQFELDSVVEVVESDLLSNLFDHEFDIIVANLPYIGVERFHFVAEDVDAHEPHVALYGGSDGLQLYKKMFQQLASLKSLPKYILGEFGFAQSKEVSAMLNTFCVQYGGRFEILPDLAGIDRVFIVYL